MKKQKKVVIITGAAGGIGRATAKRFAAEGYCLALSDVNAKGLISLRAELGPDSPAEVLALPGDLADLAYVRSIAGQCITRWGQIDVVVNNAAWRTRQTMRTLTAENWERTLKVMLTAPAFLSRWAASSMENTGSGGVIINISSVMSSRCGGTSPAYVACKGAIESLTYELAALYGPSGIRVIAVAPGNVKTELSNDFLDSDGKNISDRMEADMSEQTPLKRSAQPEEIANLICWLTTPEASFMSGTVVTADGGYSHHFGSYPLKKLQFPGEF